MLCRSGNERSDSAVFFFSSRRRHTRSKRDWSSDVCSSDLARPSGFPLFKVIVGKGKPLGLALVSRGDIGPGEARSEERRVGKECRSWWGPSSCRKKICVTTRDAISRDEKVDVE